jgi:Ca2+-binding RTX toxin-like protein
MRIVLTGPFNLPFHSEVPFFDYAFDGDVDPVSQSPTAVTLRNANSGALTTFQGTGLNVNTTTGAVTGIVTGWTTRAPDNTVVATVTGISWSFAEMGAALDALADFENEGPMLALFSRQAITVDASGATGATRVQLPDGITSAITFIGSNHRDEFRGSNGNDRIEVNANPSNDGANVIGSRGNDTIDLSAVRPDGGWVELVYHESPASSISYSYNGNSNTGQVQKVGVGIDTLVNPKAAVNSNGGLNVHGTDGNDIFTITTAADDIWGGIVTGGRGVDSYNLNLSASGGARLDFRGNWYDWNNAPQALVLDLSRASGQVVNDGFGNTETITRSGDGRLEINGTRHADSMTGGAARESFISGGGNDTMDGGGGFDRVRYDRGEITSALMVNLATGTATGQWQGSAFTHTLRNIEEIRGSRSFDDTLIGDDGNNRIDARDGNNLIRDGGGNDTVYGGAGNDTIRAGGGEDRFDGGAGVDLLVLDVSGQAPGAFVVETDLTAGTNGGRGITAGRDVLVSIENVELIGGLNAWINGNAENNALTGGDGNDTLLGLVGDDVLTGGLGNDFLQGGAGNDTLFTGAGNDTVWAGPGDDVVWAQTGNNEVWSGLGNDSLTGGSGNDTLGAGGGDDLIDTRAGGVNQLWAGAGRDTVYGADNGDQIGGAAGDDLVYAGSGADAIYLGAGNDQAYGGAGDDTIFAGPGFDRMWGGAGADRFEFYRNYGWNRVEDFSGGDGDTLALARGLWLGAGTLSAAQVVTRFGSLNAAGDAVLTFAATDTTIVIVGAGTLDGLADQIIIL